MKPFHLALTLMVVLAACNRGGNGDDTEAPQGFCAVRDTLDARCVACHDATDPSGGLDLATDPIAALVGVESPGYPGHTLVVAGAPDASFLVAKLEGALQPDEGDVMPPGSPLDAATIAAVRAWIEAGATPTCDAPDTGTSSTRYHPDGWSAPELHGHAADRQDLDCRSCHGDGLEGGSAGVSCDGCHADGWRTDCTMCHGDPADGTGAPPADVLGETDVSALSFPPHPKHMDPSRHATYDCTQCHDKPRDVLSAGHFLVGDDTPDVSAENAFAAGLSPQATWTGSACANTYCHGNGRTNGTGTVGQTYTCKGCHPDGTSNENAFAQMSGEHHMHIWDVGAACSECHAVTVSDGQQLTGPENHVNGVKDVALPQGMQRNAQGCTGVCHLQVHYQETW